MKPESHFSPIEEGKAAKFSVGWQNVAKLGRGEVRREGVGGWEEEGCAPRTSLLFHSAVISARRKCDCLYGGRKGPSCRR